MEFFRAGEALLRSSQPLLPFLAPAAYKLPQTASRTAAPFARHCRSQRGQHQSARSFTTSQCRKQPEAAPARAPDSNQEEPPSPSPNFPSTAPQPQRSINDDIASLLDSALDYKKGTPSSASSTSRFPYRSAQATRTPPRVATSLDAARPSSRSSVDELIDGMTASSRRVQARHNPRSEADVMGMLAPRDSSARFQVPTPAMDLGPKAGRTVFVNERRGQDVAKAFRALDKQCIRNSVRKDSMKQRYYERPGMKRKRLKSERWRKNFKNQFRATINLVQQMKKQGW